MLFIEIKYVCCISEPQCLVYNLNCAQFVVQTYRNLMKVKKHMDQCLPAKHINLQNTHTNVTGTKLNHGGLKILQCYGILDVRLKNNSVNVQG